MPFYEVMLTLDGLNLVDEDTKAPGAKGYVALRYVRATTASEAAIGAADRESLKWKSGGAFAGVPHDQPVVEIGEVVVVPIWTFLRRCRWKNMIFYED